MNSPTDNPIDKVTTLTFDIFGTVLDLAGSLIPPLNELLLRINADPTITGEAIWAHWRQRQRIEQYQDNLLMLGHSGYLAVKRKALIYTLRSQKIEFTYDQIDEFMQSYRTLSPYQDAVDVLAVFCMFLEDNKNNILFTCARNIFQTHLMGGIQ